MHLSLYFKVKHLNFLEWFEIDDQKQGSLKVKDQFLPTTLRSIEFQVIFWTMAFGFVTTTIRFHVCSIRIQLN